MTICRPIPSLPGYFADDVGQIHWGHDGPAIIGNPEKATGYWRVSLRRGFPRLKRFRVNRLVCEAFHGPAPSPLHHAAHEDNDLNNNRPDNLRWATPKENVADQFAAGTFILGVRHPLAKLTPELVTAIRSSSLSQRAAAAHFNISKTLVGNIRRGETWKLENLPHNNGD